LRKTLGPGEVVGNPRLGSPFIFVLSFVNTPLLIHTRTHAQDSFYYLFVFPVSLFFSLSLFIHPFLFSTMHIILTSRHCFITSQLSASGTSVLHMFFTSSPLPFLPSTWTQLWMTLTIYFKSCLLSHWTTFKKNQNLILSSLHLTN